MNVSREEWDDLVTSSDDVWLWHSWSWIESTARLFSLENHYFIAKENGSGAGGFALQLARRSLFGRACNRAYSLMMGTGGPFCIRGLPAEARSRILCEMTKTAIDWAAETETQVLWCSLPPLALNNLRNSSRINPLLSAGWQDISGHTLIANLLKSESDLWSDLTHDARRSVKRAQSVGYTVERVDWSGMLDEYYRVYAETYKRTHGRPNPKAYWEIIANMEKQGNAVFWVGRDPTGRPVAFHGDSRYRGGSWYHTGCCESDHLGSGVNYLLLWHAIAEAKRDGCEWYEIGETYPDTRDAKLRGLTVFKGKFGGELHRLCRGEIRLFEWPPQPIRSLAKVFPSSIRGSLLKFIGR